MTGAARMAVSQIVKASGTKAAMTGAARVAAAQPNRLILCVQCGRGAGSEQVPVL